MKTLNDLIKRLVDIRDEQGLGDAEIRLAAGVALGPPY